MLHTSQRRAVDFPVSRTLHGIARAAAATRVILARAAAAAVVGLLAACGGGSDAGGSPGASIVTSDAPAAATAQVPPVAPDGQPAADPRPARATASSNIIHVKRTDGERVWVANQDNDSVSVLDAQALSLLAEIPVGRNPRALSLAPDGRVWVTNHESDSITVVDGARLGSERTITLPRGSRPFGIVFSPADGAPWVVLEALNRVVSLDPATGSIVASIDVGANPRHVSMPAGGRHLLVSRFISPPLPGEATASPVARSGRGEHGGEVVVVDPVSLTVIRTIVLKVSERPDSTLQGRGLPNYLGAAAIAPDGLSAWIPSKQDNLMRGTLRDGLSLDFQSTVRAISSRILLGDQLVEDDALRVDHDNSGVASAAIFHPGGRHLFVALETSRHVAVVDPDSGRELFRFNSGLAPQGLAVSEDGSRLYVNNFMERTVAVFGLAELAVEERVLRLATIAAVRSEKLLPQVMAGKQLFYDALDTRLARDGYLSCASCHADGGGDGRTWDFTGFGEGLRRTISLRGRAGGSTPLHWSGNFDELQDFEGQIRDFAGGRGLMGDDDFAATRDPMGLPKAGISPALDALAAYMKSLTQHAPSPHRAIDGSLTADAAEGRLLFNSAGCLGCHNGADFNGSDGALRSIGTIKPASGSRAGGPLVGIRTPALREAWQAGPFLHDGSAATVTQAIAAHASYSSLGRDELARLSAFVRQIGSDE